MTILNQDSTLNALIKKRVINSLNRARLIIAVGMFFIVSPLMADKFFISTKTGGQVENVIFRNEDILKFDTQDQSGGANGTWSIFFDGSDVGLAGHRIDGFYIADDYLLLSFNGNPEIDINGQKVRVKGSDVVKFNWDTLGENATQGTFEFYFDGSDVGIKKNIDALALDINGNLILSTNRKNKLVNTNGQKFAVHKQDLVKFIGTTGLDTVGSFEPFFDGSKAGLNRNREDVNGVDIDGSYLYLATKGNFTVRDIKGRNDDILRCDLLSLPIERCDNPEIVFTAADLGLVGESLHGIQVVSAINAVDDVFEVDQNELLTGVNVLNDNGNGIDTDPENDTLTVTEVKDSNGSILIVGSENNLPSGALLTVNSNGSIVYDTNHQFDDLGGSEQGQDHFSYQAGDGNGDFDTATVTININGKNDPPIISGQNAVSTDEDTARLIALTDLNVNDPDNAYPTGFTLTVGDGANYTHSGNTITPSLNFTGSLTVPVVVNDGASNSNTFNLDVTVAVVNDAPIISGQNAVSTPEETARAIALADLIVSDSDNTYPIGFTITVGDGANYTRSGNTITPDLNFTGVLSVPVVVNDGASDSNTFSLNVTVAAINDAPAITGQNAVSTPEDTARAIVLDDLIVSDPDNAYPTGFTLTVGDGANYNRSGNTITPVLNFTGVLGIPVVVNDGASDSNSFSLNVTVTAVNDAPVIANLADDILAYTQGEPARVIDQSSDASAADGDSPNFDTGMLTVSLPVGMIAGEDQLGIRSQGLAAGQIGVSGANITYNPLLGTGAVSIGSFSGGGAGGGNLVVTFNVSANAEAVSALLHNITYINSNSVNPTGTERKARFVLTDGDGGTSVNNDATIMIELNTPPVLTDGGASPSFTEDGGAVILDNALIVTDSNDTHLESATVTINNIQNAGVEALAATTAGTAITASYAAPTLTLSGHDTVANYQQVLRSVNYNNTSQNPIVTDRSISFVANDGSADSNTVSKTLMVIAVNDQPTLDATTDPVAINEDALQQTVNLTGITAGGGESQPLQVTVASDNTSLIPTPTVTYTTPNTIGSLAYTPVANAFGTAIVTVTVTDGGLDGNLATAGDNGIFTQTFTVTVNAVNDAPSFTQGPDQNVLEDATPPPVVWATGIFAGPNESGQTISFIIDSNDNPTLFSAGPTVGSDGTLAYTLAANKNGVAHITLHAQDNGGTANGGVDSSAAQSFTITVNAVNDAPTAQAKNFNAQANMKITGLTGMLTGATDPDSGDAGYTATFTVGTVSTTTPSGGTISNLNTSTGSFDFDPPPGATGDVTFTYTVCDSGNPLPSACSAPATVTINVSGPVIWFVNPAAVGNGDGRLSSSFNNLASAAAVDASGHRIFVYTGTATSGISLNTDEWLIGQGVTGAGFDALFSITPATGTIPRPSINGTRPVIQGNVAMATSDAVRGLNIQPASDTQGLTASSATGLTVGEASVTTVNAAAVNLSSSGGTINLTSVSANGGSNGIVLNNVTGSFTVTGTDTTAGSGGTIQNVTGTGIALTNASNVSLSNMNVQTSGDDGINGANVNGITLAGVSVINNGNSTTDEGIELTNPAGAIILTNTTATGNAHNNVWIDDADNSGGNSSLAVTGGSYGNHVVANGNANHGMLVTIRGTATLGASTISGATFENNRVIGLQVTAGDTASISDFTVTGSTFRDTGTGNSQEISMDFAKAQQSNMTVKVLSNTVTGHNSHGMNFFTAAGAGTTGNYNARIEGNIIGSAGTINSGSAIGNCMRININGDADASVLVNNNTLRQCPNGRGIEAIGRNGTGGLDITITNNDINPQDTSGFPLAAIFAQSNTLTIGNTVRADIRGNTVPASSDVTDLLTTYIALVETNTSTCELIDSSPASANATAQLTSTNTGSASASAGCALIAGPITTPP